MVSEILLFGPGHASGSASETGISNFKLSCKTIINIYHIKKFRTIPSVVNEK